MCLRWRALLVRGALLLLEHAEPRSEDSRLAQSTRSVGTQLPRMPKGGSWSRILAPTAAAAAATTVAEGRSDDDGSMAADGAIDADEPQLCMQMSMRVRCT